MFQISPQEPDVLQRRTGGCFANLLGLVFTVLGACGLGLNIILPDNEVPWFLRIVVGGFLLVLGVLMLFLRAHTAIDRQNRVVTELTSFIIPLRNKEKSFDTFAEVAILTEVRRSKNSSYTVYPVVLQGDEKLLLETHGGYEQARRTGEQMAQFMGMPLVDHSSGTPVRREPEELNMSIAERLRQSGADVEIPAEPLNCKVNIAENRAEMTVSIPKVISFGSFIPFAMFIPILFFIPILIIGPLQHGAPPAYYVIAPIAVLTALVVVSLIVSRLWPPSQTVTLSARNCQIVMHYPLKEKTIVLPCTAIEEIFLASLPPHAGPVNATQLGVVLRTDAKSVEIAKGHDDATRAYLEARIRKFLLNAAS